MGQLTAEEVRRVYRYIVCARCGRQCQSDISDTIELDAQGELAFRVEITCPNCNTRDIITREGGVLTRTSEGPEVSPEEWLRTATRIAKFGLVNGVGSGNVVRQINAGREGSLQGQGLSRLEAKERFDKWLREYGELLAHVERHELERKRAYYRERHARKHARKARREPPASD